jgi:hypothetical protein
MDDLGKARPSKGFLGIQVGETGTGEKIDGVSMRLKKALDAAELTRRRIAAERAHVEASRT